MGGSELKQWLARPGLPQAGRLGLAIAAFAGLLVALAPFVGDVASGRAADGSGQTSFEFAQADVITVVLIGLVAFALIGACAYSSRLWVHLAGVVVTSITASMYVQLVIAAKTRDRFAGGASVSLDAGGLLIAAAFIVAIVGLIVALTQARLIPPALPPDGVEDASEGAGQRRSPTATTGLVMSILGIIPFLQFAAAAGVMVSAVAITDIRAGSGESGRGFALAGLVLGALLVTLYASLGFVALTIAEPG